MEFCLTVSSTVPSVSLVMLAKSADSFVSSSAAAPATVPSKTPTLSFSSVVSSSPQPSAAIHSKSASSPTSSVASVSATLASIQISTATSNISSASSNSGSTVWASPWTAFEAGVRNGFERWDALHIAIEHGFKFDV